MSNDVEATLRRFRSPAVRQSAEMDHLVRQAVFGTPEERDQGRWLIWEIGQQAGVRPASIHELYLARGRGAVRAFTTPAINIRVLAYDSGRAVFFFFSSRRRHTRFDCDWSSDVCSSD